MNITLANFVFCDSLARFRQTNDFIACVPAGVSTRNQLFDVLTEELSLPSYFGGNWDALSECLRNLSWISSHRVIVAHKAVPDLDATTLREYLDVLAECANDWKMGEEHELVVVFPTCAEDEIRDIINRRTA